MLQNDPNNATETTEFLNCFVLVFCCGGHSFSSSEWIWEECAAEHYKVRGWVPCVLTLHLVASATALLQVRPWIQLVLFPWVFRSFFFILDC